jgi:hypothetical protein
MTTERLCLLCAVLLCACALKPPPEPEPIVCEEIERAEERFPEECSDAGADAETDAAPTESDD